MTARPEPMQAPPTRFAAARRVALACGVGLALVPLALDTSRRLLRGAPANHMPLDYCARFAALTQYLPARAMIGYVVDPAAIVGAEPGRWLPPGEVDAIRVTSELFLAWHALAPRLLATGPEWEYVIGNFASAGAVPALPVATPFEVVTDLGNGVVLYRRK